MFRLCPALRRACRVLPGRKWIDEGELQGEVRGGMYFVDLQATLLESSDPLLAKMLEV